MNSRPSISIEAFDRLPDDCLVGTKTAAAVLNTSIWTLRRKPPIPKRQISERCAGWRVGDLRKLIRGELAPAA